MHVHEAVAGWLIDHGVDPLFGLMGDGNMRYLSTFRSRGGAFVAAAHEGGAVAMADAFSRVSGEVGYVTVTHGPGFTNTVTQLVEASRNRSEVMLITGSAPSEPTYPQRLDMAAVARAAEVGYERLHVGTAVARTLDRALQRIRDERRPVVVDVPGDLIMADAGAPAPVRWPAVPGPRACDPEALDRVLGLLASADRPVILAGWGAVASGAREQLIELAGRTGAALATTLRAKDFFRGHPHDLGILGTLAHGVASAAIAEADAIVAFGASLNMFTTYKGELVTGRRLAHIDSDGTRIGSYVPVDVAMVADAALAARTMNASLAEAGIGRPSPGAWLDGVAERLVERDPGTEYVDRSGGGTIDLRTAMRMLDGLLPSDRTVTYDVGRFTVGSWPYLTVPHPRQFVSMGAWASVGLGLAGAVGAACASRTGLNIAVVGDGGLMMNPAELVAAASLGRPFLVVACNDGAYGAEYYRFDEMGLDRRHATNAWPDLAGVARALGARSITVHGQEDLERHSEELADIEGLLFVDLRLDPDANVITT